MSRLHCGSRCNDSRVPRCSGRRCPVSACGDRAGMTHLELSARLESSPLFRWYLVALLAAIACLNYADRSALSSVLSLIRDDLHMSPFILGAVGSAFLWVYAIC